MVQLSSILCVALLAITPVLSLPVYNEYDARDLGDISDALEARGLDFTTRDVEAFVTYLEARTKDAKDPIPYRPSPPIMGKSTSKDHQPNGRLPDINPTTPSYNAGKKHYGSAIKTKILGKRGLENGGWGV